MIGKFNKTITNNFGCPADGVSRILTTDILQVFCNVTIKPLIRIYIELTKSSTLDHIMNGAVLAVNSQME